MEKYQEIMKGHYVRELSGTIFIVFLSVAAFVFVLIAIKKWDIPKWTRLLLMVILPIDVYCAIGVKSIKDDMQNQSYITYYGEYYQICKGLEERQSTTIYVDEKEKHDSHPYEGGCPSEYTFTQIFKMIPEGHFLCLDTHSSD